VFIAVLSYGVVPHNERTDDFEAKITTVVSSEGSSVLYHYKGTSIYYKKFHEGALVCIQRGEKPSKIGFLEVPIRLIILPQIKGALRLLN